MDECADHCCHVGYGGYHVDSAEFFVDLLVVGTLGQVALDLSSDFGSFSGFLFDFVLDTHDSKQWGCEIQTNNQFDNQTKAQNEGLCRRSRRVHPHKCKKC